MAFKVKGLFAFRAIVLAILHFPTVAVLISAVRANNVIFIIGFKTLGDSLRYALGFFPLLARAAKE